MAIHEPAWDLYRSFRAVLRAGSLSAAARELGLTQPTIGRHIGELEMALGGLTLFTRSQQGLIPTETATALAPHAEAMAQAAAAFIRTASGAADAIAGTIRLTASVIIGGEVLPPILAAFRRRHPAVDVELVLSNRADDLLLREADIAVRMMRPTQAALVARELGSVKLGLHASADYLAAAGVPATFDDLEGHSLIGFDQETPFIRRLRDEGIAIDRDRLAFRSDSDLAQLAAIRAGFGIGVCQTELARRDARLVRVLADQFVIDLPVWLVMHEDLRGVRRMRAMADHLAAALRDYLTSSQ
ncbi:MAG TPA: LysR family transcriptional regulator [Dongiaceae bacterium]|nr:LysR family transcriptional regulator [Dongiaceae bacterium]